MPASSASRTLPDGVGLAEALVDPSFDLGWSLIQRFSVLSRESGSLDERAAAHFISSRLESLEIPHDVHEAELHLSLPRSASVVFGEGRIEGKAASFSVSTPGRGVSGAPVHLPLQADADGDGDEGEEAGSARQPVPDEWAGKIVIAEGYPEPSSVARLEAAGAIAQLYVNPGSRIHWSSCSPIWGSPGESQMGMKPKTPVVSVDRRGGDLLLEAVANGLDEVVVHAELDEGWYDCPLPVARIDGLRKDFVLVHGHYDSWDIGIGSNAVGNATMLELARLFHERQGEMRRSLRIAWWPGTLTGSFAGSAWYADNFALEIARNCVAAVNVESPGCLGATDYDDVVWMAEAEDLCRAAIASVTEAEPTGGRPPRAGDYSFNELGVTSLLKTLSKIPSEERERLGYYPVGGCGGNIAWRTEADRLKVADRSNLERDLRVYLTLVSRLLNDEVLPLDFRRTAAELDEALAGNEATISRQLGKKFSLAPLRTIFNGLVRRLDRLYEGIEDGKVAPTVANRSLVGTGRALVRLGYAEKPRFEHGPALEGPLIPALARVPDLERLLEDEPDRFWHVVTSLRRRMNLVVEDLQAACQLLDDTWNARGRDG